MLRRATASSAGDTFASEQPEPGTLVLRHPQAAYLLHAQLQLLRRIRRDAAGLLRRAQAAATPHPEQLRLQPYQRWLPQRFQPVRHPSVIYNTNTRLESTLLNRLLIG